MAELTDRTEDIALVESFWEKRIANLSLREIDQICKAYVDHVVGAGDWAKMGRIHGGLEKEKGDYCAFYGDICDIINPNDEEIQALVHEGFCSGGLITKIHNVIPNPYTSRLVANMHAFK